MSVLNYRTKRLCVESAALDALADAYGTPLYVYSHTAIRDSYLRYARAFGSGAVGRALNTLVAYSAKANANGAILRLLARLGAGLDVVSGGELYQGLRAGFAPEKIVFAGVGKTESEIRAALRAGIAMFNVESLPEGEQIAAVARSMRKRARVALRINPDVDAGTHAHITTGRKENKFGIAYDDAPATYAHLAALDGLEVAGLHAHIGSQILSPEPFVSALRRIADLVARLRRQGARLETLNLGGGAGIAYREDEKALDIGALARRILPLVKPLGMRLILEPGRSIVAQAGILVTRIVYVKRTASRRFAIVDASMTDLIRPSLYSAYHRIVPVRLPAPGAPVETFDVVGGVCESGDFLAKDRSLPPIAEGDLLAVADAGAYGYAMASNYNGRLRPAEVLVRGRRHELVRRRERLADLLHGEIIPHDLK